MSWGPGTPDIDISDESGSESDFSEESGESIEEEQESTEMALEDSQSELYAFEEEGWRTGSSGPLIRSGEYSFLPVFGFNEAQVARERWKEREDPKYVSGDPTTIDGKELTWWEEQSILPPHPYILINPVGWAQSDVEENDFRKLFRLKKGEQFVFCDSGGYQVMSMDEAELVDEKEHHKFSDLKVHPETLVEWQVEHADAGATLDFPPYNISGDATHPDSAEWGADWADFYVKRRGRSADMVERMAGRLAEMREEGHDQAEDYIFAPVIHGKPYPDGYTQHMVREWHEEMDIAASKAGVEPRGWVLKPEPSHSFGQIAMFLGYAAENLRDVEYLHVLMVGGMLQKALLMYYAIKTGQFVTSDASSYAAGGKRRQYNLPKTATRRSVIISNRSDEEREDASVDATRLDRHPCRCTVCSSVERDLGFDFITHGSGSAQNSTINLHNLQQVLMLDRTMDALLREDDVQLVESGGNPTGNEFWRYVSNLAQDSRVEDLYRAMDYVRLAIDEDLDVAEERYNILWDWEMGKSIEYTTTSEAAGEAGW